MSRIGKKPVLVPDGVEVAIQGTSINVKGKNGELSFSFHPNMTVAYDTQARTVTVTRPNDQSQNRALHGLTRSLIANMVQGMTEYFEKKLEIQGVGYNAVINGKNLDLQVGFANSVCLEIPNQVVCELPDPTHIVLKSCDKQAVGHFAAVIRKVRPPEPYKGKGIRYQGEQVRRKAGKAFAGGA